MREVSAKTSNAVENMLVVSMGDEDCSYIGTQKEGEL